METRKIIMYVIIALLVIAGIFYIYRWMTADKKEGFERMPINKKVGFEIMPINQKVETMPAVFRMFYVDWCGHCRNAKPEFDKILGLSEVNGQPVKILKINAEVNQPLAMEFGVNSYPTFILSKSNGENLPYLGLRNADSFKNFLASNI